MLSLCCKVLCISWCLFVVCAVLPSQERPLALIVAGFGKGHVEPLLQLGKELSERDVDVLFTALFPNNDTEIQAYVEKQKLPFLPIGAVEFPQLDPNPNKGFFEKMNIQKAIGTLNKNLFLRLDSILSHLPDSTFNLTKKPSVIIYELFSMFGAELALKHSIPGVLISPSMSYVFPSTNSHVLAPSIFVGPQVSSLSFSQRWFRHLFSYVQPLIAKAFSWHLNSVQQELGLPPINIFNVDEIIGRYHHLYIQTGVLPISIASHQNPMIHSVGPLVHYKSKENFEETLTGELKQMLQDAKENAEKVIYITFGSVWEPSNKLTSALLKAATQIKHTRIIWARGALLLSKYGIELSEQEKKKVYVGAFLPQKAILSHEAVKVVVSHCGMGGMGESMFFEKTILGMPLAADQFHVAARIRDAGVGLTVEDHFIEQVKKVKTAFQLAGGVQRAAELVEFVMKFGNPHFLVPFYQKIPWWQAISLDTTFASLAVLLIMWLLARRCCARKKQTAPTTKTNEKYS